MGGGPSDAGAPEAALAWGDRTELLAIARAALGAALGGGPAPAVPRSPALLAARGAFVTLRDAAGQLRGCVGQIRPEHALHEVVARMAVAAATLDDRFARIARTELAGAVIEISALGP